jgi:mediator of RNA polymerase II transcription subunit 17
MDDPTKGLGEKLRRIFVERGVDFFDKNQGQPLQEGILTNGQHDVDLEDETCRNGENPEESFEHSKCAWKSYHSCSECCIISTHCK